jgi:hypothetical protein
LGKKRLIDTIVPDVHLLADVSVQDYYKNWLLHYSPEAEMTNLLTSLLMLSRWAFSYNIKLLIFSNVDVFPSSDTVGYNSPFLNSLVKEVHQDISIIDPWTFSFGSYSLLHGFTPKDYLVYQQHGHPDRNAHEFFSKYLIDKLEKLCCTTVSRCAS